MVTPPEGRVDGRRQRSERTRAAIVEAYLAIVNDGATAPTANQISERAGVSVRSVFERFVDLDALRLAVADHAIARAADSAVSTVIVGGRAARVRSHVEVRAHVCERWLRLWRALSPGLDGAPQLRERIETVRTLARRRFELIYRPELDSVPEDQRRRTSVAIETLIDFESWGRMRELYRLSFDEACAIWVRAIDRLLPPTPPVS